jgi:hypothetical protein
LQQADRILQCGPGLEGRFGSRYEKRHGDRGLRVGRIDMELVRMLYDLGFVMTVLVLFAAAQFLTVCVDEWLEETKRHHGKR